MNTTDFPVRFPRKSKIALLSLMLTGSYVFGTMPNALAENTNYFQVSDSSKLITNNETIKNQLFYVIKKGETIESIAKSQQVSVSTLQAPYMYLITLATILKCCHTGTSIPFSVVSTWFYAPLLSSTFHDLIIKIPEFESIFFNLSAIFRNFMQ